MKTINEQINPEFVIQAKKLAKYTRLLHEILPIECRNHVEVANIRNQNLMLVTDSPVWTTRLRQLSPQILQHLRDKARPAVAENTDHHVNQPQRIHHVQISTRYNAASTQNSAAQQRKLDQQKNRPKISEKTAEILSQSADSIENEKLKSALLKIARHAKDAD